MKKYISIAILLVLLPFAAKAQLSISYSAGYADFKMTDMKEYMNSRLTNLQSQLPGIDLRLIDNFPSRISHNGEIAFKFRRSEFGVSASYLSTGSKIGYADYSGKLSEKIVLNGYRVGLVYRYYTPFIGLSPIAKLSIFGEITPSAMFTRLKYDGFFELSDGYKQNFDNVWDKNGTSFSAQPMLGLKLDLLRKFAIRVSGGYEFNFESRINRKINVLNTPLDLAYPVDWSGLRLNAGIVYNL